MFAYVTLLLLTWGAMKAVAPPPVPTDVYVSQCGFVEDPIVVPAPPPPSPPPSSPPPPYPPSIPPPPSPPSDTCGPQIGFGAVCGAIFPNFRLIPGVRYIGGVLQVNSVGSAAAACIDSCASLAGCAGFSQNLDDGTCTFQNSTAVSSALTGFDSWRTCTPSSSLSKTNSRRLLEAESSGFPRVDRTLLKYQKPAPQLWSSSATWPNGVVPGVGAAIGANVTIPCGTVVILDVPNITVSLLRIQGLLRFLDDPSVPIIYVKASYVLVEGQLFIGSSSQSYRQKATIELTPNTAGNRAPLMYTYAPPADSGNPRNLGHKAFAVVGGQVQLYGLPGPSSMPVWVRLSKDAYDDDTTLQVDADVSGSWPIGGEIVVASSDYDRNQAEKLKIVNVTKVGNGQSVIALDQPLTFRHHGTINGVSDGFGGFMDQRAEVMLLTRNIVITGTEEPSPNNLEGGHFVIFRTNYPPQYIEGVEFFKLGQQGQAARHSLNFHIVGSVPGTVCRKNAIHQSRQRCINLRASHNITIDSNVAFNTSGHCFTLDEGGEENNTFINNLGVRTISVTSRISTDEWDINPAIFYIANVKNRWIGNVAAGSQDQGYNIDLRGNVRGESSLIRPINQTNPMWGSLTLFLNNVAHSNGAGGFRAYNVQPKLSTTVYGSWLTLDGIRSYKNIGTGFVTGNSDSIHITNSVFADNGFGVHLARVQRVNVSNSRFVALSTNLGNPTGCWDAGANANCRPVSPSACKMPLKWGAQGRSTGGKTRLAPSFGVFFEHGTSGAYWPHSLKNNSFYNYDPTCSMISAIATLTTGEVWNPAHNVEGLKFSNETLPIWTPPQIAQIYTSGTTNGGEQSQFYTIFDKDGSLTGSRGYIVANNTPLLPPAQTNCKAFPAWNAYACTNVCYRTISLNYVEPGFGISNSANINNTRATFSYLKVTRASDRAELILDGNLREISPSQGRRGYFLNLLANQTYRVEIVPPTANPTFQPNNMTFAYRDVGECGQGLTLQFKQGLNKGWTFKSSSIVFPKPCPGIPDFPAEYPTAQFAPRCVSNEAWMEVVLSPGLGILPISPSVNPNYITILSTNATNALKCATSLACGLIWSGTEWLYDDSGLERRPAFYNPILSNPENWKKGLATLGSPPTWNSAPVSTIVRAPNSSNLVTYYFRKNFLLRQSSCLSSITIEALIHDGLIVYINNFEALRINMPTNFVDNKTNALVYKPWLTWETYVIPISSLSAFKLKDGSNTIAVEQHMLKGSGIFAFDVRLSAVNEIVSCNATLEPGTPEICDGVDNDLDGIIDEDADGNPLITNCSTPCGVGIMTCINGFFQQCTAVVPSSEVCDGLDNNCDGLVDNGKEQLNCTAGDACWQGKCVPSNNATTAVRVWPRSAPDWMYNDGGKNLDVLVPNWRTGAPFEDCSCGWNLTTPGVRWLRGVAPLGYDFRDIPATQKNINTETNYFVANGKSMTAYFAKSFSLTAAEVNKTFNIDFSVRRADGVVVYLNGEELWRENMNWGPVLFSNRSTGQVSASSEYVYHPCRNCRRNNSALLKPGMNYIVAELHLTYSSRAVFDLDLYRNVIVPCPDSSTNCARHVEKAVLQPNSDWKFLDGSLPLPPVTTWMTSAYNDSSWLAGTAPIGFGSTVVRTQANNGSINGSETLRTLYFRKTMTIPDGGCYIRVNFSAIQKDGLALYVNGVEAFRSNLLSGPLNSTVYASGTGGSNWVAAQPLSTGWLRSGDNLLAAELHRSSVSASWLSFDLQATGLRDAISCSPDPTLVSIPWLN